MRYLFRLVRQNGSTQDYEEDNTQALFDDFSSTGVSIEKVRLYYTLENDPENRQFDQSDDAEVARGELIAPLQANVDVAFAKVAHYDSVEFITP